MQRIGVLDPETVAKIAAGEIVQRPFNVVKELLENAADAGATAIRVVVSNNCYDTIMVCDTGSGIHPDDYPLLCHRFATSKISTFTDIYSLQSFGFRGEALASLSFMSHLLVVSKTPTQSAHVAAYDSCKLIFGPVPLNAQTEDTFVQHLESDSFTIMCAMDLFYSEIARREQIRAARAIADIQNLILSAAAANYGIGYSLSIIDSIQTPQQGWSWRSFEDTTELSSLLFNAMVAGTQRLALPATRAQRQRMLSVVSVLMDGASEEGDLPYMHSFSKKNVCSTCSEFIVYFTEPMNHSEQNRRLSTVFIFANGRGVQYPRLRNAMQSVVDAYLPAFTTIKVTILWVTTTPGGCDPNVHPSKERVLLLEEDAISASLIEEFTRYMQRLNSSGVHDQQQPQIKIAARERVFPDSRVPRSLRMSSASGSLYKQRQDGLTSILRFLNTSKMAPNAASQQNMKEVKDTQSVQSTMLSKEKVNTDTQCRQHHLDSEDAMVQQVQEVRDTQPVSAEHMSVKKEQQHNKALSQDDFGSASIDSTIGPFNFLSAFDDRFTSPVHQERRSLASQNIQSILSTLPTDYEAENLASVAQTSKVTLCGITVAEDSNLNKMLLAFMQSTELSLICVDAGALLVAKMLVCYASLLTAHFLSRDIFYKLKDVCITSSDQKSLLRDHMFGLENNGVVLAPHLLVLLAQHNQMYNEILDYINKFGLSPRSEAFKALLDSLEEGVSADKYKCFPEEYAKLFVQAIIDHASKGRQTDRYGGSKTSELTQLFHILSPTLFTDDEWRCYTLTSYSLRETLQAFNRVQ